MDGLLRLVLAFRCRGVLVVGVDRVDQQKSEREIRSAECGENCEWRKHGNHEESQILPLVGEPVD